MPFALPPWLDVTPQFFTSALEAGARTGLAVADQSQRAQQMAEARAERQAQMQQRAEEQASRDQEFQQTHLLNVQKVAQDAAQLQQQIAHQSALEQHQQTQESRLLNYDTGRLAVEKQRADLANKQANLPTTWNPPVPATETAPAVPGYFSLPGGRINVPEPHVASMLPQERYGKPVYDSAGSVVATDVGGGRIIPLPKAPAEGHLTDVQKAELRSIDQAAHVVRMSLPTRTDSQEYIDKQQELGELDLKRKKILNATGGVKPRTVVAPPTVAAPTVSAPAPVAAVPTATVLPATNAVPTIGATGTIHPLPNTKSALVVGDIYDVNGVARRWDGKNLIRVENAR